MGSFSDPNNAATPLGYTAYVATNSQGGWIGYSGTTGGELDAIGDALPNASALAAIGFPALASLAFKGLGQPDAVIADTIAMGFTAPLAAGAHFYLWDPGATFNGNSGTSTFTFSATLNGKPVDTSGWTFRTINAQGGNPLVGTYATSASAGTVTVSNYQGAFVPEAVIEVVTSNALDQIKLVASTLGADSFGLSLAAPGSVVTDTVAGASGAIASLPYDAATVGAVAQAALNGISGGIGANTLVAYLSGTTQPVPGQGVGTVQEVDNGGLVAMGSDVGLIDAAAGPVTAFGGTGPNETVASGLGGLTFVAGSGGGQLVAGGSNTFISQVPQAGNWNVTFGPGRNTVVASTGNDTITTGTGANLLFLGSGNNVVHSAGVDTIVGFAGPAAVDAVAGAATVGVLAFGQSGGLTFLGGAGVSTVVSLGGSLTVQSGSGGGLYFGGTGGNNRMVSGAGPVTMFGGGSGDVLVATGGATDLLAARAGSETLTGAGSTGNNAFFAGSGADLLIGGSGTNSFTAGSGSSTMVGGSGLNLFVFNAGVSAGQAETIQNWNPARDFVSLQGFGPGAGAAAVKGASQGNGNTTVTLADGTHVIFAGVGSVGAARSSNRDRTAPSRASPGSGPAAPRRRPRRFRGTSAV